MISNEFKCHHVYVKDFDRFMFNKTKNRNDCLVINGKQSVKLKSSSIRFKNYSKQIPAPFKIYADFDCILKKADCDIIEFSSTERN